MMWSTNYRAAIIRYPNDVATELQRTEPPPHPGRVLARLARQVEIALASADLTLPQYRVLILLCERHQEASVLADKLAVSRPSVTGVVDGLVARGLVQRRHDPDDRRRVCHWLTEEGRRLLAAADSGVQERLHQIAELRPDGGEHAFAGLESWQAALDVHRARCAAARCSATSATATAATATAATATATVTAATATATAATTPDSTGVGR